LRDFAAAAGEVNWRPIARCWFRTSRSLCRRKCSALSAIGP